MAENEDRRAAERMPVNAGTACSFGGAVTDIGPVRVRDVSLDGVGLVLTRRPEGVKLLAVTLTNPEKGVNKTVLVRVAHVTPIPGGFLVGGSFAEPLTYQELTALVL